MKQFHSAPDARDPLGSAWLRRVRAVESFEEQWQRDGSSDIGAQLPNVPSNERRELLHELIKIDLEYRWQSHSKRHVEDYAVDFPEIKESGELPLDLIIEEIHVRATTGVPVTHAEIEARFPGRSEELISLANDAIRSRISRDADTLPITAKNQSEISQHTLGKRLGRYELLAVVGQGAFATVYRAKDSQLRREVAIKVTHSALLLDPAAAKRVQREAASAARLRHPAIVPVHEVAEHLGQPFIVSALVPGPNLAEKLRQSPHEPEQVAAWVQRIAEGLDYAHQQGVIHRDVKPANILFDADCLPLLVDFGLARDDDVAATLTRHGDLLGTPAYMSPEQAAGRGHQVDGRTDVYSLGVVLYEMLCGQVPFQGSAASVLQRVIHDDPPSPRQFRLNIPNDLETICLKAMSKEPHRRYATAGDMAADLQAFREHRPISARRTGVLGRFLLWCRRNPAIAATIGVAMITVLFITSFSLIRIMEERDRYLREREIAIANLYESLVRESRALRLTRATGYRNVVFHRLQQALELETPAKDINELRQEAAACLGDFVGLEPDQWFGFREQENWITAVACQPESKHVAVGCSTGLIRFKNRDTGAVVVELHEHKAGIFAISFSKNGKRMATMDDLGATRIWEEVNLTDWKCLRVIQGMASPERNLIVAVSCALSSDGERVIACAKGESAISLWNATSGEKLLDFRGPSGELFVRAAWSPDGETVAGAYRSANVDGVVLWNVKTQQVVKSMHITRQAIVDIVFSADGRFFACGCNNGTFVFDTVEWRQRLFVHSDDQFFTVAFHPERPWIAVPASRTNRIQVWDVVANQPVAVLSHPGAPHSVTFSPDGRIMLSATGESIRLWDLNGGGERRLIPGHTGVVNQLCYRPDGKVLASCGKDGSLRLWEPQTGRRLSSFSVSVIPLLNISSIAFSPDGKKIGAVDWQGGASVFDVSDPEKPKLHKILLRREFGELLWHIAAGPKDGYWAIAARSGVRIWRDDQPPLTVHNKGALFVAVSPDGRRVAWTGEGDGKIGAWDLQLERAINIAGNPRFDSSLTFYPDSDHVLGHISHAGLVAINLKSSQQIPFNKTADDSMLNESQLSSLGLNREHLRVTTYGVQTALIDIKSGKQQLLFPAEGSAAQSAVWSPDQLQVAVGLTDGTIVLWDVPAVRRELRAIGLDW